MYIFMLNKSNQNTEDLFITVEWCTLLLLMYQICNFRHMVLMIDLLHIHVCNNNLIFGYIMFWMFVNEHTRVNNVCI